MEAEELPQPRTPPFTQSYLKQNLTPTWMDPLVLVLEEIIKKPDLKVHNWVTVIHRGKQRTVEECFQMYHLIHQLTTNPEDILMATKDVIKEFQLVVSGAWNLGAHPEEEMLQGWLNF